MKIAIIGTGGVALATAALLHQQGSQASLVSLTGDGGHAMATGTVTAMGAIEATVPVTLAPSAESALRESDHIILATSADRYHAALEAMLPHLEDRHCILISGELSQFSAVLEAEAQARGVAPAIVALASTLVTGRRKDGPAVQVGLVRKSVLAYSKTAPDAPGGLTAWNALVGGTLAECDSPARILLSNMNPIVHAPNALCNFTRIDKGEDWSNYGGISAGVASLLIAFDAERLEIGQALGLDLISFEQNFARSHGFEAGMALDEMATALHERRGGLPKGPTDTSTRYITEDVPFGLAVLERLGAQLGIATPMTASLITVFSGIYARDFRQENPFLDRLNVA